MNWLQRLRHREQLEHQLERELRFHLEEHIADLVASGYDPDEARRRARADLGGPEQVKESCRDARGTRWLEDFVQDLRYALRALHQKPGFAAVALLTLALGIGATTVMFTVFNGVLLRPLPYPEPGRLLKVDEQTKGVADLRFGDRWAFAYPNFLDCVRSVRSLELAAFRYSGGTISGLGEPEYVDGLEVSSGMFSVLQVPLFRGRSFLPEEDRPGAAPEIIISYSLWQRRFGGSASTTGASLLFEGKPYTIVGILPAGFHLQDADVFTPLGQNTGRFMESRESHPGIAVWARLRPGVTFDQAQSELDVIGRRLAAQYPKSNSGRGFIAEQLRPEVATVRPTIWLLLGAVSLVLLIACVNIASLLLARAVSRDRELAMRMALGASRSRLARQCLTESGVLGLLGGALGALLAAIGLHPFLVLWPGTLPRADEIQLDWRVLLFALAVSVLSGFLFGLAPALRAPGRDLEQTLRAGARTVAGGSRRLHGSFVISEIALAVVLLVSAGLLGHTLVCLSSLDPGVNIRNVLIMRMAISPSVLADPARIRASWQNVLESARRVPGVLAISMVDTVPMRQGNNQLAYWPSPSLPARDKRPIALATCVTPDYLKVMGIPLRRGRFIIDQDRMSTRPVVVIDDVLAQRAFGDEEPVGKSLWIPEAGTEPLAVVGVVGHVRHWGLAGDDQAQVRAQLYYPFAQVQDSLLRRWSQLMSIAVRTGVEPLTLVEPLRKELRGAAGDQVLYEVNTMEKLAAASLAHQRFLLALFGVFAGLALLQACVGIYGVLAYVTSRRVPEMGIRIALGASPGAVLRLVLRQSLGMICIGVAFGAAAALAAERIMNGMVEGMQPAEPWTLALMILVLIAAALAASYLPARRASLIDPATALRQE